MLLLLNLNTQVGLWSANGNQLKQVRLNSGKIQMQQRL